MIYINVMLYVMLYSTLGLQSIQKYDRQKEKQNIVELHAQNIIESDWVEQNRCVILLNAILF